MEPRITPIDATLGAVVTDLDLSRIDALTWKTVEQAFHEHGVLVFPRRTRWPKKSEAPGSLAISGACTGCGGWI